MQKTETMAVILCAPTDPMGRLHRAFTLRWPAWSLTGHYGLPAKGTSALSITWRVSGPLNHCRCYGAPAYVGVDDDRAMVTCPNGHPIPAHHHFCGECGASIAARPPAPKPPEPQPRLEWWEEHVSKWPLATVALIFLVDYSVDVLARPHGWATMAVWVVGIVAWASFAVDYLVRTILALRAHNWRRWSIRTKNLFDLLIMIPWLGPLRLVRVVIAIRALHRAIGEKIRRQVIVYTVGGTLLLVYVASLAELEYERGQNPKIQTFPDALWWSITTITTVGYGDKVPVTQPGRLIAVLLMIFAIGLVGSITATLASWLVQRIAEEEMEVSEAVTAAHIAELRADIRYLADELRRHGTGLRGGHRQGTAVDGQAGRWQAKRLAWPTRRDQRTWRSR